MSPAARSLSLLAAGYTVAVVERRIHRMNITQDLYGCIDLLAVRPGEVLGVQVTSGSNHAARRTKSAAEPRLKVWLLAGGKFEIHGWRKGGKFGARKLWTVNREPLSLADLIESPAVPIPVDGVTHPDTVAARAPRRRARRQRGLFDGIPASHSPADASDPMTTPGKPRNAPVAAESLAAASAGNVHQTEIITKAACDQQMECPL